MLSDTLTVGDKIDIIQLDKFGKPYHNARSYVSQLMDFEGPDIIHIATPIVNSTSIILNTGENYSLCFYTENGLFQCNCVVLKNVKEKNIVIAVVRITTKLEKYQRRQYYRLDFVDDIKYRLITKEEEILKKKFEENDFVDEEECKECRKKIMHLEKSWETAMMKDISGGGTRFVSEAVHKEGDILYIELNLAMNAGVKRMVIKAVIVSSEKLLDMPGMYEYRVEFIDIMKKDREELVQYIFEQERRRRKKV